MQEGWLWERRPGRLYGSTWKRRWCEVNGGRLRVYDANKAREVATIHIRAETTLCDRLTEDEVRRVGRAPQAGEAAVYFRLVDRVGGRSLDFAAESEADAARWIAAITPTPVGDLLSFDVPGPVQPPPPLRPSLSQPPPPQPPQPARQPSEPVLATGRVLATVAHAWEANEPWQIDADAEEVVEVLGGPDQDGWVEVRSPRRGGSGAIPASYLASTAPDAPGAAAEAWERATETAARPPRPEAAESDQHERVAQEYIDARQRWGDPQAHMSEGERVQLSDRSSEASSSRDRPLRVLAVTLNCSDALPRTVELRAFLRHGRVARRGARDVLADVVAVTLQDVGRCAPILVAMIEAHLSQHERVPNACIKYLSTSRPMRRPERMFLLVFRRRDVEVSDATHGPVIDGGLIKGACCAALTCAVADKSYRLAFIGCHLVTGMLERLNDALRKILDAFQSLLSSEAVVFMFGDLNYRINRTYDDALKDADAWATVVRLANERSIPRLAALDGLTRQPQVNIDACGLAAFWTPALNFLPTSPVRYIEQVKLHRFGPTLFKKIEYKIPVLGYTDRVLFRPGSNTDVTCVAHESVPAVTSSDHKSVSAAFEISAGFGIVHGDIVDLATSGSDEPPPAAPARPGAAGPIQHAHIAQEIDARRRWGDPQAHIPEGERVDRLSDDNVHQRSTWTRSRPSASAPATTPPPAPPPAPQSQKNQEHAALIADVQWTNVYAAKGVDGVTHSDLLMTRRHYRELAEGHERDLVHELRDYEASGGDLDAIRRHIDDAASVRAWDMFLTNYKRFLRTGDAS